MKQTLHRLFCYLFFAVVLTSIFRTSWPDAPADNALHLKVAFYFTKYGLNWLLLTLAFMCVDFAFRRRKTTKPDGPHPRYHTF